MSHQPRTTHYDCTYVFYSAEHNDYAMECLSLDKSGYAEIPEADKKRLDLNLSAYALIGVQKEFFPNMQDGDTLMVFVGNEGCYTNEAVAGIVGPDRLLKKLGNLIEAEEDDCFLVSDLPDVFRRAISIVHIVNGDDVIFGSNPDLADHRRPITSTLCTPIYRRPNTGK